jgi:hypothetical protein
MTALQWDANYIVVRLDVLSSEYMFWSNDLSARTRAIGFGDVSGKDAHTLSPSLVTLPSGIEILLFVIIFPLMVLPMFALHRRPLQFQAYSLKLIPSMAS